MSNFSVEDSIKFGWQTFKAYPWFFIGAAAIVLVVSWISSAISPSAESFNSNFLLSLIGLLASFAISTLVDMGFTSFSLKASANVHSVKLEDIWHPKPFWKYFGAALLTGIVVMFGFILLIVPGVILALMFAFVKFIVIEHKLNPIQAMKESARITKGHKWKLLVFVLLICLINLISIGLLFVGVLINPIVGIALLFTALLVSIPVSALAMAHAYRTLARASTPIQSA